MGFESHRFRQLTAILVKRSYGFYFSFFLLDLVASKLAFTKNATISREASGRSTEIQWSLFMWYAG